MREHLSKILNQGEGRRPGRRLLSQESTGSTGSTGSHGDVLVRVFLRCLQFSFAAGLFDTAFRRARVNAGSGAPCPRPSPGVASPTTIV